MSADALDLDVLHRNLSDEPYLGKVERYDDCVAVFVGSLPVFVSADTGQGRIVVWTVVAEVTDAGGLVAARASNAYNATHYHETGMAMSASVERKAVFLGRSLDAHGTVTTAAIVDVLREVEKHRRVAEAHLGEASAEPEETGAAPSAQEDFAIRV